MLFTIALQLHCSYCFSEIAEVSLTDHHAALPLATFDHVVIETTGLADPAPIIQTFRSIQVLSDTYACM